MHGSVFLDASDNVIRPALLWCDARTADECAEITAAAGGPKGLFDLLGQNIVASFTLPKVLWLRKHEPENFARLTTVLLPKDYIRFLLTGNKHSEISDASGTGILDVRNRTWSKPLAAALDIDLALFPPLIESPEIAGHITAAAAATTGLREGIPVVGHIGMVPRHVTWTGYRSLGKTVDEAKAIYQKMKDLENAGAYAAEIEIVPHNLASWLSKQTSMLLMSLGSGTGCDTQFLFSCDILGDYDERIPRHAKSYRNFAEENRRLQNERIAAFSEYVADVKEGRFPERCHLTEMDAALLDEVVKSVA
jgi:hypothetical protein